MKPIYQDWIKQHVTNPHGTCYQTTIKMQEQFPELIRMGGYYGCYVEKICVPHWWLIDREGNIVDPTAEQFSSKGKGNYEPSGNPDTIVVCCGCGEYFCERESEYAEFCGTYCKTMHKKRLTAVQT